MAGLLLQLAGGKMYYLKLMKLMYIIDREGLLRWGRPITNDRYYSLDNGLILSRVENLMTEESLVESYWNQFISAPRNWQIELTSDPETDELSEAETELIREQYLKFKRMFGHHGVKDRWELVEYTHNLPEWVDPHGSSIPVDYEEVLIKAQVPPDKVRKIIDSLEEFASFENALK
jgi:hypothetical protein